MTDEEKLENLNKFKPLIKSIARKYSKEDCIYDDLCIVGEVACLKAIESFNKDKKTKLSTFLYGKIEGAIKDEIKTKYNFFGRKSKDKPIPLSDVEGVLSYEIEDLLSSRSDNEQLKEVLSSLTEEEKKIIYLRYWEDMTFAEISKKMRMNETKISKMNRDALKKIKEGLNNEIYC